MADLLSFLSNPLGSAISAIGGYLSNKQQAKENEKNREWSEMMWNKQNEFNLPVNQMKRLLDAGLNANLVYNDGAQTLASYAGNLGTDNSYKNPLQAFNPGIIEAMQLRNQTNLTNSQVEKNEAEAEKARRDADKTGTEDMLLETTFDDLVKTAREIYEKSFYDKFISKSQANLLQNQSDFSDYWRETTFTYKKNDGELVDVTGWQLDVMSVFEDLRKKELTNNQIYGIIGKLAAETKDIYKGIEQKNQYIKLMKAQEFQALAQADYFKAASYMNSALGAYYQQQTINLRELLPFEKFTKTFQGLLNQSGINLNKATVDKIYLELDQSIQNQELDRYLNSVPRRYEGTGAILLNFIYESLLGIEGENVPYYTP